MQVSSLRLRLEKAKRILPAADASATNLISTPRVKQTTLSFAMGSLLAVSPEQHVQLPAFKRAHVAGSATLSDDGVPGIINNLVDDAPLDCLLAVLKYL